MSCALVLTLRRRRWKQSERLTREAAILAKFDRKARSTRTRLQVFIGYSLYGSGRTDIFCLRKEITIYYDPWSNPDAFQAATLSLDDADWLSPSRVEMCGQILGLEAHDPSLLTPHIVCSRYLGGKYNYRDNSIDAKLFPRHEWESIIRSNMYRVSDVIA